MTSPFAGSSFLLNTIPTSSHELFVSTVLDFIESNTKQIKFALHEDYSQRILDDITVTYRDGILIIIRDTGTIRFNIETCNWISNEGHPIEAPREHYILLLDMLAFICQERIKLNDKDNS